MSGNEVVQIPCIHCKVTKPISEFSPAPGVYGVRKSCKPCESQRAMQWRDANRSKVDNAHLIRTFGITLGQFNEISEAQHGVCAICQMPPSDPAPEPSRRQGVSRRLVVDHCHDTSDIRGLLCQVCNSGLGQFRDNPDLLRAAAKYLEQPSLMRADFTLRHKDEYTSDLRKRMVNTCGHPDRRHKARGRCTICDRKWRLLQPDRRKPECHPHRLHVARGMCGSCVVMARRAERKREAR